MTQVNQNMNFLPEDYVEKRQAARSAVVFIGLLLIVVGGIMGTWMFKSWSEYRPVVEKETLINQEFEAAGKPIAEAQEIDAERAKMVAKAELTTTLMERVRRSAILKELTDLQPKGVSMFTLDLKTKEIKDSTPAPARPNSDLEKAQRAQAGIAPEPQKRPDTEVTIDLVGTAPTDGHVAQYIAALSKSNLFIDVNLQFSEEYKRTKDDKDNDLIRKFRVEMKINPAADLRCLNGDEPLTDASGAK